MSNGGAAAGDGLPITLNNVTYAKGLGTHAASTVRYAIPSGCSTFSVQVGVDDEVGSAGSVIFRIHVDSPKVYDSGKMTGSSATKSASVNVSGKSQLVLVVHNSVDGVNNDHGDWANARFICAA